MSQEQVNLQEFIEFAKQMTIDAGEYIIHMLQNAEIEIHSKTSDTDLVTQVDREVEQHMIDRIAQTYPNHTVVGEEGMSEINPTAEFCWFIDPIDGTTNFIHQKINFCISVALYKHDEGLVGIVYDPIHKEMFWAAKGFGAFLNDKPLERLKEKRLHEALIGTNLIWVRRTRKWGLEEQIFEIAKRCRGIRSLGSAALEIAYVAAGRLDGFLSLHLSPWDYGAAKIIILEVGGQITDFNGMDLPLQKDKFGLIASRSGVHHELILLLQKKK